MPVNLASFQNGSNGAIGTGTNYPPVMPLEPTTPTTPATPTPNDARSRALALARLGITQELGRRGLDPTAYAPQFDQYLNNILNAVPQTETNYDQYFSPNLASDVLTGIQAGQRNPYK